MENEIKNQTILFHRHGFVDDYNSGYIFEYQIPEDVKDGICVDVGCNDGAFTNVYKDFFKKIYFIEPQKELYKGLVNKFKDYEHLIGINLAVWSEDSKSLTLVKHTNNDSGSVGVKEVINNDWTNEIINLVDSISLDTLNKIINTTIDYIKIDCENSEYEFLYGKDLSNIRYICMELHVQMGEEKFNTLINHIQKTHNLISGLENYDIDHNQILLYILR
jgi:FkbM family methyltransferase